MRNPFRTEADSFRFLFVVIAACVLIVVASSINVWVGLAVAIVESLVLTWWIFFHRRDEEPPLVQAPPPHPAGERRILVVANETVGGRRLLAEISDRSQGVPTKVLVVCPALNTPVKHWTNEEEPARAAVRTSRCAPPPSCAS